MEGLKEFDVIIIGAGPSGSSCAFFLDKSLDVLILEQHKLPRNKVCGTGVLSHVFETLDYRREDIPKIAKSLGGKAITEQHCVVDGKRAEVRPRRDLYNFCIPRDRLDYFITRKALRKGIILKDGEKVTDVLKNRVITAKGEYRAKVIVDASGVNSVLRRKRGIQWKKNQLFLCYRAEVPYRRTEKGIIEIYPIDRGYAWVFPQARKLDIGIGFVGFDREPKKKWAEFLRDFRAYSYYRNTVGRIQSPDSWMIPMMGPDLRNILRGRHVLVGDAGGFVNPINGEGIYFGVLSGKLAARAINDFLLMGKSLKRYVGSCKKKIVPECRAALLLRDLVNKKRAGELVINMMNTDPEFNERFHDLMEGIGYANFILHLSLRLKLKLILFILRLVD